MTTPGMQGEVSPESMGKTASSAVGEPTRRETGHFRNDWEHCGTKSAKALLRKAVRAIERAGIGKSKRKSRLILLEVERVQE
jgi:hypothetical protein